MAGDSDEQWLHDRGHASPTGLLQTIEVKSVVTQRGGRVAIAVAAIGEAEPCIMKAVLPARQARLRRADVLEPASGEVLPTRWIE